MNTEQRFESLEQQVAALSSALAVVSAELAELDGQFNERVVTIIKDAKRRKLLA